MNIDFTDNILALEVDKIYYQNTDKKLADQAQEKFKILDIHLDKVPMVFPPKNSSDQTKMELEMIARLQKDWNPSEELLKKCDDNPDGVVFGLNDKVNKDFSSKDINADDIMYDLNTFIMKMKTRFGRARPYQVCDYHNVYIDYNKKMQKKGTANTPSYPSGHTAAAYFAAGICSYHKPELEKEFLNLANIVAMSRIKEGVHFPSDNEYAIKLVEESLMPAYLRTLK